MIEGEEPRERDGTVALRRSGSLAGVLSAAAKVETGSRGSLRAARVPFAAGIATLAASLLWTSGVLPAPVLGFALGLASILFLAIGARAAAQVVRGLERDVEEARELGNYHLEDCLGRGGMGEVWRARHRLLPRPAAVKFVLPEALGGGAGGASSDAIARFRKEARATTQLSSPHTIEIYDFGVTADGSLCYVMEFLEGLDLETLVRSHGPMDPARVVYLLRQVCISLAEAHQRDFIHRDIKPANIYVCRKGIQHDFVKVLDFGMVAEIGRAEISTEGAYQDSSDPNEDSVGGTPAYMAPEIARGRNVDPRTDIYSLGCVAYWMLTGQKVFEADSLMEMLSHHLHDRPDPLSRRSGRSIPRDLELLVLTCLQKNPDDRIPSAHELSRRLARCRVGPPWTAGQAAEWWGVHEIGSRKTGKGVPASGRGTGLPTGADVVTVRDAPVGR
jgi:serine/threonine-protein kinase